MRPKTGVMSPTLGTSSPARQAGNLLLNLGDLREQMQWILQPLTAGKQVHHDNLLSLLMYLLNLVDVDLSEGYGDLMEQMTAGKLVRHDVDLRQKSPTEKKERPTIRCRVCYLNGARRESTWQCKLCPGKPGLCINRGCFKQWHEERGIGVGNIPTDEQLAAARQPAARQPAARQPAAAAPPAAHPAAPPAVEPTAAAAPAVEPEQAPSPVSSVSTTT